MFLQQNFGNLNLMTNNDMITQEAENTLKLVSTVQADLSNQPENNHPELREALLKLKELAAELEELTVTHQ